MSLSLTVAEFQPILLYVWKSSVGYHGNKGRSEANLDNAVKLPDPENPHFGANIFLLSLKIAEFLPFEVAIGRNANFQILGKKGGKCENSSSRPPSGTSLRENASFDV